LNRVLPQRFLAKGMSVKRLLMAFAACLALLFVAMPISVNAAEAEGANGTATGASGLPVPRFVSLKPARVNLRIGPGRDYSVSWLFMKAGLPVEIIQEYDNWRRIRDADGTEGWVYQSLLSGKRTAITAPWLKNDKSKMITMRRDANDTAAVAADIEPGVVGTVRQCTGQWCRMDVGGVRGWIRQSDLWGVYPGEVFD
jgi:SH3-like domain-containing protein